LVEIVPARAENVAALTPAGTVIVEGTVRAGELVESKTAVPPLEAGWERLTVHVVLTLDARLPAMH
jgi:hypothetical protein